MTTQQYHDWCKRRGACEAALADILACGLTPAERWAANKRGDWMAWLLTKCNWVEKVPAAYAKYWAKRNAIYAEYKAKYDATYAEYQAKYDATYAEYQAKRADLIRSIITWEQVEKLIEETE